MIILHFYWCYRFCLLKFLKIARKCLFWKISYQKIESISNVLFRLGLCGLRKKFFGRSISKDQLQKDLRYYYWSTKIYLNFDLVPAGGVMISKLFDKGYWSYFPVGLHFPIFYKKVRVSEVCTERDICFLDFRVQSAWKCSRIHCFT